MVASSLKNNIYVEMIKSRISIASKFQTINSNIYLDIPAIWTVSDGSITPEFGFTQYLFGAVVLILKQTLRSEGFVSVITDETAWWKGPANQFQWLDNTIMGIIDTMNLIITLLARIWAFTCKCKLHWWINFQNLFLFCRHLFVNYIHHTFSNLRNNVDHGQFRIIVILKSFWRI